MTMSTNEWIGRALDCLKHGPERFVRQKMRTAYGEQWENRVNGGMANGDTHFDAQALLNIMKEYWPQVFRPSLGHNRYGLIKEVRNVRNRWAHQEPFSSEEVMRALEAIRELLVAVGAPPEPITEPVCDSPVVTTWEQIQQNIWDYAGVKKRHKMLELWTTSTR